MFPKPEKRIKEKKPLRRTPEEYFKTIECCSCGKKTKKRTKYIKSRLKVNPEAKFFCSLSCSAKSQLTNEALNCLICGKAFYCSESQERLRKRQHCSRKCKAESMKTKVVGSIKKRRGLAHKVQDIANLYARKRDCGTNGGALCISCGGWYLFEMLDGGHFIPTTSSAIRYDERNINAQCRKCNRYLSGNGRHYAKGMLKKYGQTIINELEALEHITKKWTYEELDELYQKYKQKVKEL